MPNYATTANLIDEFEDDAEVAHLTDSETGVPNTAVLTDILDGVEGEINSYLRAADYAVPLDLSAIADAGLTAHVKRLTLDMARAATIDRKRAVPENIEKARTAARDWLVKVRDGVVALPTIKAPTTVVASEPTFSWGSGSSETDESKRAFTRESQSAW